MNYYERHIGDYLKDTAHLSLLEHGVYTRLLDVYYTREGGIPDKEAARLIGARSKDEREALAAVLAEFFVLVDGLHMQQRCGREIERYQDKQAKAKRSAEARWSAPKKQSEGNANAPADAMRTHSERNADGMHRAPVPSNQTPDTSVNTTQLTLGPALPPEDRPALTLVGAPEPPQGPPDCPHLAVLALWAEVLPQLPQHIASQWRGSRADHLRARWRETAVEKGWTTQQQGIDYLRKFFAYVGQSDFLAGRSRPSPGKRPFVIELEWLVNPSNWAKVHEGKYHGEAA